MKSKKTRIITMIIEAFLLISPVYYVLYGLGSLASCLDACSESSLSLSNYVLLFSISALIVAIPLIIIYILQDLFIFKKRDSSKKRKA